MCRVLAYIGEPIAVSDLLYEMDSSLLKQVYAPKMLGMLNLAGFGLAAWDQQSYRSETPFAYKTTTMPVFDPNLKALADKISANAVLAHVRGVEYSHQVQVSYQNLHPFRYTDIPTCLAHNGDLAEFDSMKYALLEHIKPALARQILGTTDSEWIYALLLSQFDDPSQRQSPEQLIHAIEQVLRTLRTVRLQLGIAKSSSVNLFVCDGVNLVATRFTFDFGCYGNTLHEANLNYLSLWYTTGKQYGNYDNEWKMVGGAFDRGDTRQKQECEQLTLCRNLITPAASAGCAVQHGCHMAARVA